MRKLIIAATTIAFLAVPAISMASVGHIAPMPTRSLTATTVYNAGVTYVHKYTLTTQLAQKPRVHRCQQRRPLAGRHK